MDDLFDEILDIENQRRSDAVAKGVAKGERFGFEDGLKLGNLQGHSVASEVGYYEGFVTVCMASMIKVGEKNDRKMKMCELFLERVRSFPYSDPEYSNLHEDLDTIRAKFKQLCTMLHVRANRNSSAKADLSF